MVYALVANGLVHVAANTDDVELVHRHASWIVPVLELALVATVIADAAGIAAARTAGRAPPRSAGAYPVSVEVAGGSEAVRLDHGCCVSESVCDGRRVVSVAAVRDR